MRSLLEPNADGMRGVPEHLMRVSPAEAGALRNYPDRIQGEIGRVALIGSP